MRTAPGDAKQRSPAFSVAACILPLVGAVVGLAIVAGAPPGDAGWPHVILGPQVLPACAFLGLLCSVVGFVRRESFRALTWVALFLSGVLLVYGIMRLR